MSIKASRILGLGVALAAVGVFAACSSDDTSSNNNKGGSTSTGGQTTSGGGGATSTGGTATGGSATGGTATGGSATGGTATGGAGTGGAASTACKGTKPAGNLITDFSDAAAGTTAGQFAFNVAIPGGTFSYPADIKASIVDKNVNFKGSVKTYSGFGLYLNDCHDAAGAGATGVSFNIKGKVGTTGKINFRVQTNANTAIDLTNKKGTCDAMGATPDMTWMYCAPAAFDIPVTEGGGVVEVKWTDLAGGKPNATIDGKDVVGFEFAFAWMDGGTAYDADVTVDDVKWLGTVSGGGGAGGGGAGGAAGGGAGGTAGGGAGGGGAGGGGNGGTGGQ